jgi:hypothetical protein
MFGFAVPGSAFRVLGFGPAEGGHYVRRPTSSQLLFTRSVRLQPDPLLNIEHEPSRKNREG